jgi:hypothetical protein
LIRTTNARGAAAAGWTTCSTSAAIKPPVPASEGVGLCFPGALNVNPSIVAAWDHVHPLSGSALKSGPVRAA